MFRFYADPALTTPVSNLPVVSLFDGSAGEPVATVVYFGNPTAGRVLSAEVDDEIEVAVVDAAAGAGLPATAVRLALTEAGLSSATPGAMLALGASLSSGASANVAVWLSIDTGTAVIGDYTDLSLVTNSLIETAA